jgi:hypothetical protein
VPIAQSSEYLSRTIEEAVRSDPKRKKAVDLVARDGIRLCSAHLLLKELV